MFVLTVDQRRSRSREDLVEDAVDVLNSDSARPLLRRFERTAGDEMQAVIADASVAGGIALDLATSNNWSVGIGIGTVDDPLPESTRAGSGQAFERAREAVTAAKTAPGNIAVSGARTEAGHAEAVLQLLVSVARKRSKEAREAGELSDQGLTQQQIAERLGITQQAVSSRLHSGLWHEWRRGQTVALALLEGADR
ncbi:sigma factor-like helix-turn-helix DNA-binding protein [Arthrobacter sulfonylureivorans]|uniref:sigma factor-like helix-turn-helix DNA-binding protein n=1 Tax=Arthrobacter sulfonylureivorans TaxID=2486855 RepID=UPI0039E4591E